MTQKNNWVPQINRASLAKNMLVGGSIALALIAFFLISAGEPNPEWGRLWMVKPLIIVPLAGAAGGAFYYFMALRFPSGWVGLAATIFSVIVYIIILWVGSVLGLNGTHWD